jgi:hypothetical protein
MTPILQIDQALAQDLVLEKINFAGTNTTPADLEIFIDAVEATLQYK